METKKSKARVSGKKSVTGQTIDTPFGKINIKIRASGYKSSEGDIVYEPPVKSDDPSESEVETTEAQ